jgi:hypothetical protein
MYLSVLDALISDAPPSWAVHSKTLDIGTCAPCPVFRRHNPPSKPKQLLKVYGKIVCSDLERYTTS